MSTARSLLLFLASWSPVCSFETGNFLSTSEVGYHQFFLFRARLDLHHFYHVFFFFLEQHHRQQCRTTCTSHANHPSQNTLRPQALSHSSSFSRSPSSSCEVERSCNSCAHFWLQEEHSTCRRWQHWQPFYGIASSKTAC